jgi:hypothetical protein
LITFALELQQVAVKRLLSILLEVLDRLPLSADDPEGVAVMEAMTPHLRPLLVSLVNDLKLTPQDHTHEMQLLAGQPCSPMDPWSFVLKVTGVHALCPRHSVEALLIACRFDLCAHSALRM